MRATRLVVGPLLLALVVALATSCAADEGRRRSRTGARRAPPTAAVAASSTDTSAGEPDHRGGTDAGGLDGPPGAQARTLRVDRFQTIALPDPAPPAPSRPPPRGRVNVELDGAPFDDVARMLSDVGRFGLVVEAPSAGTVDATLRDVDAWDALLAIAHAKGLVVTYERGIGVVRMP